MILVRNKKKSVEKLLKNYPNSIIVDVTSNSESNFVQLSPFYPHGDIPVPFSNITAESVEGIWQGLKVFEEIGIDRSSFKNNTMKNLKRTVRKYGLPRGHQKGVKNEELLPYIEARLLIYLPSYKWVLENKVKKLIQELKGLMSKKNIILLDYETNEDILNPKTPLSHAALVKLYLQNRYPDTSKLLKQLKNKEVEKYLPLEEISLFCKETPRTLKAIITEFKLDCNIDFLEKELIESKKFIVQKKKFKSVSLEQTSLF